MKTSDFLKLNYSDLKNLSNDNVRKDFSNFIKEFNRREWKVRIDGSSTFKSFKVNSKYNFKTGFNDLDGQPVPYFHPNRSFHDEIIWLNDNLFYNEKATFEDRLINSAIVKFYGPSSTLKIIVDDTDWNFVNVYEFKNNVKYTRKILDNLELTKLNGTKIWGTTELRTSLQTASRNYARNNPSLIDILGTTCKTIKPTLKQDQLIRKMRPSDMLYWILGLSNKWINFYKTRPTMKESFEFLTSHRGIGNYYGYHFSSNLARMPEIGSQTIINIEHKDKFNKLNVKHGNLDENADYVVAGPGASKTFSKLFKDVPVNHKTTSHAILLIRDNQIDWFDIKSFDELKHLKESSELGQFTTFGIEISMCQFNVFESCNENYKLAAKRAKAPISINPRKCAIA